MVSLNSTPEASNSLQKASKSASATSVSNVPVRQSIALISDNSDPALESGKDETSGQSVYVRQVGEALAKLGWQVDIFTRKIHPDSPKIVQHSPHCRTIRLTAGPEEVMSREQVFPHLPEFVEAFQKFQAKEGANYPLVHTNHWLSGWVGLQLKEQSNIQLLHTYHSIGAVKYQSVPLRPAIAETRLAVEQSLLEKANCVVATSPQEEEVLRSFIAETGYIEVVPAGTDIDNFHIMPKAEARAKLKLAKDEAIVLYVGRFDPQEGLETLVKAFAQLKQWSDRPATEADNLSPSAVLNPAKLRLLIVGADDPEHADKQDRASIEALVQSLGLADQTQFVGRVGHDVLPLYYTAADVCAIPSRYEPFGLVALEAMACGTPVVASAVGGLKFTIIPEETGLLVPPQDADAFAEAIARILTDELWAHKFKRQAPLRVQQNFSWSGVAAQLSNLYRRLLAQSISHEGLWNQNDVRVEPPVSNLTIAS